MIETLAGPSTLKRILHDHWNGFAASHKHLRPSILEEAEKVLACRDPLKSGYHLYRCPDHPECERIVPHTCKSRFCSSCGTVAVDNWIEEAMESFLDVPYRHLVFTIPQELRNVFLWDRKLFNILFDSAKKTVLEWCRAKKGYVPGIVMVIHTFGSDLKLNPHIHMLLTQGGLSVNREAWIRNEFIPYDVLKSRWKTLVVKRLKPAMKRMILEGIVGIEYSRLGTGKAFHSFLGFLVPIDMVRPCWRAAGERPIHDILHRTVYQTASIG